MENKIFTLKCQKEKWRGHKILLYFYQMLVLLENHFCTGGHYSPVCFPTCVPLKGIKRCTDCSSCYSQQATLGDRQMGHPWVEACVHTVSFFSSLPLTRSGSVSGVSTSGALGPVSTTTSTTPRMATSSTGRPTTTSALGRRNRSTSMPSPMADVPDEMTTHLPPASSQLPPAGAESCDPMEARDIMWSRTRQGQVAKQPCPMGSIGE